MNSDPLTHTNDQSPTLHSYGDGAPRPEDLKVAVLAGGISPERDVSLQSGQCVEQALKDAQINVVSSDITPDELTILDDQTINVFFIALHGSFGEDGQLQEILENRNLIYTGSGPLASKLAFDKYLSKTLFAQAGVHVPPAIIFHPNDDAEILLSKLKQLGQKLVVKPIRQGSAIGVSITENPEEAIELAKQCSQNFGQCMFERYICGKEITVGVIDGNPLPILEIRPANGFYDYDSKYTNPATEYLFDTIEDPQLTADIRNASVRCFNALGCRHFARVDFILGDDNIPYALEINTIPGLTTHSLLPKAAERTGLSMTQLCSKLVTDALKESSRLIKPASER